MKAHWVYQSRIYIHTDVHDYATECVKTSVEYTIMLDSYYSFGCNYTIQPVTLQSNKPCNFSGRDLSRNRLRLIEGLTFQGLSNLEVLKLQRNNISKLTDGAFFGLARMRTLWVHYVFEYIWSV